MENIKIKYKIDYDRLKDRYFSAYGVTDDDYLIELDNSTAENMRNFDFIIFFITPKFIYTSILRRRKVTI